MTHLMVVENDWARAALLRRGLTQVRHAQALHTGDVAHDSDEGVGMRHPPVLEWV